MLITDLILVIVFAAGFAGVMFYKEDEIDKWAKSKHGRRIKWQAAGANCVDSMKISVLI